MHIEPFGLIFLVGQSAFFKVVERQRSAHDDAFREMKVRIWQIRVQPPVAQSYKHNPTIFFFFFLSNVWHNMHLQDDQSVYIFMASQRELSINQASILKLVGNVHDSWQIVRFTFSSNLLGRPFLMSARWKTRFSLHH